MELDVPGANECGAVPIDAEDEQMPSVNPLLSNESAGDDVSAEKEDASKDKETTTATDLSLDGTDASVQPLETGDVKSGDELHEDDESAVTNEQEEDEPQIDVVPAEPTLDAASLALDSTAVETSETVATEAINESVDDRMSDAVLTEAMDEKADQGESDAVPTEMIKDKVDQGEGDAVPTETTDEKVNQKDGGTATENDGATAGNGGEATQFVDETNVTELSETNAETGMPTQQHSSTEDVPMDIPASYSDNTDSAESSVVLKGTDAALSEKQAENDVSAENEGGDASESSKHDESEYGPSASTTLTSSVPHGDDEYDPANPSSAETPAVSNATTDFGGHRPAAKQEEYDPDRPSMTPAAPEEPVAMEVDLTTANDSGEELSSVTPVKRKADDEANSVPDTPANGSADVKRLRHVDDAKSPRDDDHKHGRHRRGSGDSTVSSSSKQKHHEEDHKGLSAAAWDRLMDFQASGEFRVTQVSRAAFASVGAMPEFAQIVIIARFVRTPMRDVRDKNGQLMRIFREYQKENPQIAALQPVGTFISDYKSDPGLFHFGYAPPQPVTGMSSVQVPYHRDQPPKDLSSKQSPRQARGTAVRSESDQPLHKDVDEFGRVVHLDKGTTRDLNGSARSTNQQSAADPRLSSRGQSSPSTQAALPSATGGRAEDPRHGDRSHARSSSGAGRDPRRRGSSTNQQLSPRRAQPGSAHVAGSSDLYERLPAPVKAVVNSMRHEGRLQEPLNDNVVTRLLHLPEHVALQAVENFSNVDLSQVENLQGFLVGIINRVNEKAIASEKQHRPQASSPRGHPPLAVPLSGNYGAPSQGGSVLGGPPQGERLNSNNVANGGSYRGQPAPAPALYERPYDASQDIRDPRRPPQYGGAVRGPPPTGSGHGPIEMQSFAMLPMSVQNHVHSLVANRTLASLEELGGKCYEVLGQLSEPLANQVLTRFAGANLSNVRNKSGFLIGVVKRARQEYGFN